MKLFYKKSKEDPAIFLSLLQKEREFHLKLSSFKTGNQTIEQFLHLNNFQREGC